ncbi:sigma-54 interaction domain-containing protein [Caldisalinibacter kiritimatiensis]|uniref:Uncharacterized protein n=1 Tax=Caldisalinibacter kiritimatiensis TaxID=1304284 RepID=R1AW49_9FIRM|nr:sigma-54-dependent Fis family transcriptional regulator [Caldisalinibacter kiritimatiensis]EOD00862.1 hypothetical protein L21TH_1065 [Caldisalinibacter kiritimatiensis]
MNDKTKLTNDCNPNELKKLKLIFNKIMEISDDGFLIVNDKGFIIEINKAYCEFLGLKKKDIIGKYVTEIIKNSKLPKLLSDKNYKTEVNVIHKLLKGQTPTNEKYAIVTRAPVKEDNKTIAAVGQVKFSHNTMKLAEKLQNLDMELQYYKKELKRLAKDRYSFNNIIGKSKEFIKIKELAKKAINNDFTVLLTGETGTGKEVFANAIHYASRRRNKPFIRINCAAIPSELLESELFGYVEGSFTGARRGGKKGKFELADGGTIFLDEIGEMPMQMQAKLLRVLQEREIEKVGSYKPIPIDVRVIAATNKNLREKIRNNTFREDLYYRLNVIEINIPPLRNRREDIELFADYFLDELNEKYETNVKISKEAKKVLNDYSWPGNVRELKNVIERAYVLADEDIILNAHLPTNILTESKIQTSNVTNKSLEILMEDIERRIIIDVLSRNNFNCRKTAKDLGIHRSTLYKKMERLNIKRKC